MNNDFALFKYILEKYSNKKQQIKLSELQKLDSIIKQL